MRHNPIAASDACPPGSSSRVLATPRHLSSLDPAPLTAELPSGAGSVAASLWWSKEIVFILLGIAVAFTVHFGFGDFVQTESSTPKLRAPAATSSEIGVSDRVRAAAFERAARRSGVGHHSRSPSKKAAVVAGTPTARSSTPSLRRVSPPTRVTSPSPAPAPIRQPAVSKPRPAPARNAGGGGQSFDDSG
jgi:hypothetical protein